MLGFPLRCCGHVKFINNGAFPISPGVIGQIIDRFVDRVSYSKGHDKKDCCKEIVQTAGKKVEPWPKADPPPPAWRFECPADPQPPNYDPYRIKVPDVVVPPLPPSNAKALPTEDSRDLFKNPEITYSSGPNTIQDLFHNSPIIHPDYWKSKQQKKSNDGVKDALPRIGYHGRVKYKYAFHEPWKPLDRMALLETAEKEESDVVEEPIAAKNDKV